MPHFESLLWQREGHVVTITLNRPHKKNAMSWVMFDELGEAFERAAADEHACCVIVTGAGDAFCSGADLSDEQNFVSSTFDGMDRMRVVNRAAGAVITCPKPTISRVTGIAAGAGCNLALACDLIVASTEAAFAELFVRRGLVVDFGGTWALSRALPLNKAKEFALLGGTLSASEAHALGLVNRLCAPDEIDSVVDDLAARLCALPSRAVALIKSNLVRAGERSLEQNLDAEARAQAMCLASADAREAIVAWAEGREPRFGGN